MLLFCPLLRADVGLVVETPTGILGFLSDVGHASIWISRGCISSAGEVYYCEGTSGVVLTSTAYWPSPGAAAIPADLFFLGTQPGRVGRSESAWNTSLQATYPKVDPEMGRKFLGRAWLRSIRVHVFTTTETEDREVIVKLERQRRAYQYSYVQHNCAYYAEQVLKLYLGQQFHAGRALELGIVTPRSLERALNREVHATSEGSLRTVHFKGRAVHFWRQPPRNLCESALFDPKYAVPLLMYQPFIYLGFGVCYGIARIEEGRHATGRLVAQPVPPHFVKAANATDDRVVSFESLAGPFAAGSPWAAHAKAIGPAAEAPDVSADAATSTISLLVP